MKLADLFTEEDYRFHMALRRATAAEFFAASDQGDALLAERKRWLTEAPDVYAACLPEGRPLLDECIAAGASWGALSETEHERLRRIELPQNRCTLLGEIWEPDFLLLQAEPSVGFRLVAGCVCFPSSWSLVEKMGRPLEFIHTAVPGLNQQIGRSIDLFLNRLAPGAAWLRHNWGLGRSPELNQHPARALPRLDDSVSPGEVWLRVEHQALVALPQSGGILFGIRLALHSLAEVKQDSVAAPRLARALRTMPEDVALYKGLAAARSHLAAWLDP